MRLVWLIAALVVLLVSSCNLVLAEDVGAQLESEFGVCEDTGLNARLHKVAAPLTLAAKEMYPGSQRLSFRILADEKLNACALGDGRIYITEGMMRTLANKPDADLAAVLAHEATHVCQKHHKGQMKAAIGGLLAVAAAKALGANDDIQTGVELVGAMAGARYSKDDEYRADSGAVDLLARAGYNPLGMAESLSILQSKYGDGPAKAPVIGWFASHPDTGRRVDGAKRRASELGYGEVGGYKPAPRTEPAPAPRQSTPTTRRPSQTRTAPVPPMPSMAGRPRVVRGTRCVVVVDPKAGQANSWGFGRGYYYDEDLSGIAVAEAEDALEKNGYQVLVSSRDVGPLQEEIELSNSEWGARGEGRAQKGEFAGAEVVFYTSAYVWQERNFRASDWRKQIEAQGLKVGVALREINLRTRKQIGIWKGDGTVLKPTRIRVEMGDWWNSTEVEVNSAENLARQAIGKAVRKAAPSETTSGYEPQAQALPELPAAPRLDRPRNVEVSERYALEIRPKGAASPIRIARFEATLTEVMATNRVNLKRGGTVVATVDVDYNRSDFDGRKLVGTLRYPSWVQFEKELQRGVDAVALVETSG